MITVDADGLTIYEGRVESLLAMAAKRTNLMVGTPVFETLKEVMAQISPLNSHQSGRAGIPEQKLPDPA